MKEKMMGESKRLECLDFFRIIAALLVVAIHTSPLASFSENADFIVTRVVARCAVPFFLMVTGYFTLSDYLFDKRANLTPMLRFIRKSLCLYAVAVLLYLPVNLYAGHFKNAAAADILRMLIFDGTFYHLWYLPASVLGMLIVLFLRRKLPFGVVAAVSTVLYCIGLAGDSYYGVVADIPVVGAAYDAMFQVFSYTRNGIFYAPVFLVMGAYVRHMVRDENTLQQSQHKKRVDNAVGFLVTLILMVGEGLVLHAFHMQRHDSMYIALLPCMFFLFQLILGLNVHLPTSFGQPYGFRIRYHMLSMWLYLLHPFMIIVVRGVAKFTHLEKILVTHSLVHYAVVCILSCLASLIIELLLGKLRNVPFP